MERDHERLAREMAREGERLERESEELESQIEQTRSDWRAKQRDPNVPGAVEPEGGLPDDGREGEQDPEKGPTGEPARDPGRG